MAKSAPIPVAHTYRRKINDDVSLDRIVDEARRSVAMLRTPPREPRERRKGERSVATTRRLTTH